MIRRIPIFLTIAIAALGCMTMKSNIQGIDVPEGLDAQQVESAILAAVAETRGQWFVEERKSGLVVTAIHRRRHYLRVAIAYDAQRVDFTVEDSQNLRETEGMIHSTAVKWIHNLEIKVRRALGEILTERSP